MDFKGTEGGAACCYGGNIDRVLVPGQCRFVDKSKSVRPELVEGWADLR